MRIKTQKTIYNTNISRAKITIYCPKGYSISDGFINLLVLDKNLFLE